MRCDLLVSHASFDWTLHIRQVQGRAKNMFFENIEINEYSGNICQHLRALKKGSDKNAFASNWINIKVPTIDTSLTGCCKRLPPPAVPASVVQKCCSAASQTRCYRLLKASQHLMVEANPLRL